MKVLTDRNDNYIGDGTYHCYYRVEDFNEYPQISSKVSESATTETVYVRYYNEDNDTSITVRFSDHISNAVEFGDQLDGNRYSKIEILFHLGLAKREFIQDSFLSIETRQVAKKQIAQFEQAELTIQEMYALGENADLSAFVGKIAKNSNYLIISDSVKRLFRTRTNRFGFKCDVGRYVYSLITE